MNLPCEGVMRRQLVVLDGVLWVGCSQVQVHRFFDRAFQGSA